MRGARIKFGSFSTISARYLGPHKTSRTCAINRRSPSLDCLTKRGHTWAFFFIRTSCLLCTKLLPSRSSLDRCLHRHASAPSVKAAQPWCAAPQRRSTPEPPNNRLYMSNMAHRANLSKVPPSYSSQNPLTPVTLLSSTAKRPPPKFWTWRHV